MMGSIVCDYKYQLYKENKNNKYIINNKKGSLFSHRLLGTMLIPIKILCYKYLKFFISCGYIVIEHLSVAGTAVATICG